MLQITLLKMIRQTFKHKTLKLSASRHADKGGEAYYWNKSGKTGRKCKEKKRLPVRQSLNQTVTQPDSHSTRQTLYQTDTQTDRHARVREWHLQRPDQGYKNKPTLPLFTQLTPTYTAVLPSSTSLSIPVLIFTLYFFYFPNTFSFTIFLLLHLPSVRLSLLSTLHTSRIFLHSPHTR